MAYRKATRSRTRSRTGSYPRRPQGRTNKRPSRSVGGRRRSSSTVRSRPQTVKIVVEMAGTNPVARPFGAPEAKEVKPRKAKF